MKTHNLSKAIITDLPQLNKEPTNIKKSEEVLDAFSVDFDGCLIATYALGSLTPKEIIDANQSLLNFFSAKIRADNSPESILMVGTNRQSYMHDHNSSQLNRSCSCFPVYIELHKQFQEKIKPIPCKLDRHLITDTAHHRPSGESFNRAMRMEEKNHLDCILDGSKVTLLYLQMHKLAVEHPGKKINYHFFDDNVEILNQLNQTFRNHPDLLPANITLNLFKYWLPNITTVSPIQGTGPTDTKYAETLNRLWNQTGTLHENYFSHARNINRLKVVRDRHLSNQKNSTHAKINPILKTAQDKNITPASDKPKTLEVTQPPVSIQSKPVLFNKPPITLIPPAKTMIETAEEWCVVM